MRLLQCIDDMFSSFNVVYGCDIQTQTDTQTDRHTDTDYCSNMHRDLHLVAWRYIQPNKSDKQTEEQDSVNGSLQTVAYRFPTRIDHFI